MGLARVLEILEKVPTDGFQWGLLEASLKAAPSGLFMEFGVATGGTLRFLAGLTKEIFFGFDSFVGLPEDWNRDNKRGAFDMGGNLPTGLPPNVVLVPGLFQETLPRFLQDHPGPVAFVHFDADLYSSTAYCLSLLTDRLADGAVLNFNEFADYPGWPDHEARAFAEWLERNPDWDAECLGRTNVSYSQAAFRLRRLR